ncbi:MAG: hypothetical protein HYT48_02955 [Candidatus Vogelbacteria bacterium]|nr:hypothetical protein [Candidatus Vogelbacteria bacterium]
MSTKSVCDIGLGQMHEFALVLDKAGFNADIVQEIISSRGNKKAETMLASLNGAPAPVTPEPPTPTDKFIVLADLGIMEVPADFDHATYLAGFKKRNRKKFYFYNEDITDENFPRPSRILKPGDKFRVKAFRQTGFGTTTSEERMAFIESQRGAVYTGAQGAGLVFEQKREQLPKGYWYASFDKKKALWEDAGGRHRVPQVGAYSDSDFDWNLNRLEDVWVDSNAFFVFCDLESSDA